LLRCRIGWRGLSVRFWTRGRHASDRHARSEAARTHHPDRVNQAGRRDAVPASWGLLDGTPANPHAPAMTQPTSLPESLKEYVGAFPEAERPDALHQLFYGFYSRIAILDRTTHELSRWAKSDITQIAGVEPLLAEALRD